ncbi:CHASE2 domain-containing protein [Ancylobacter terrae]|uniref:CHASE2 domain-containing protein n=1 Tax=Ancylobacter sp. sgz301288 TaxID=3342077 RepID=UPI003858696A
MRRHSAYAAIVTLPLVIVLGLIWLQPASFSRLRNNLFDFYQRLDPRPWSPDLPVRILDIDDASLARLGQWPWPRNRMAELVTRLAGAGAASIGFDIAFSEADRTSPDTLAADLPEGPVRDQVAAALGGLPSHDDQFAAAIAAAPVVLGVVLTPGRPAALPELPRKFGIATAGDDPLPFLPGFTDAVVPLPGLAKAASGLGALNWLPDGDQIVRQVPLFLRLGDQLVPGLAAESLRVAQGASTYVIRSSNASGDEGFGASTGISAVRIGAIETPTDRFGDVRIRVGGTEPRRFLPAWKLFSGELPADEIAGRIILVGSSAAGLLDLRATPIDASVAGVEVQAQTIEHLVTNARLARPDWATGAEIVVAALLGLLIALVLPSAGAFGGALIGGIVVAALCAASWWAFREGHVLLDPVGPGLAASAVYLAGTIQLYSAEQRQKRWVRDAFGRFVSPAVIEQLATDPGRLVLGGEIRTLTVMFSDVRSFTSISERMDAQALTRFMNRYLSPMTDIVLERRGTLDKYIGDAIMAFWNAPLDDRDHARHATGAALAMLGELEVLNATLRREAAAIGETAIEVRIGIGLATGDCCVGNFGSVKRFDYSALGDTVNLASRLEGATKFYGVVLLATDATHDLAPDLAWLEVDTTRVKGRSQPVRIFTLVGDAAFAATPAYRDLAEAHGAMLGAYRAARFEEAAASAERAHALAPGSIGKLYDVYHERCRAQAGRPADAAWDYVTTLLEK